jgi:lipoyl-dependent peroxiredoxin
MPKATVHRFGNSLRISHRVSAKATTAHGEAPVTTYDTLTLPLSTILETGGSSAASAISEQLFAAVYSVSFLSAMKVVAEKKGMLIPDGSTVTANVGISKRRNGHGLALDVELTVELPGLDYSAAEAITLLAHSFCAYSHAVRNGIDVRLSVV